MEESTKRRFLSLQAIFEIVTELAPAARQEKRKVLAQLQKQLEESTKGRFLSLQAIFEIVTELAPAARLRKAKGACPAPKNNWRNRQKDAFCPCRRFSKL
ncbi:hypothetical protein [Ureibacillus sinduriensis]|uniref:hypothetical protein n=1 Tax=Ureibacillus sinduriensis TaxID=561440 RepID=UPI00112508D5|nr:hypothetical protein [Ureibacillus sinduriensis]